MQDNKLYQKNHNSQLTYMYKILCKEDTIIMDVENRDLIRNADGDLDCPLETVLRRHQFSFDDLNNWNVLSIQFIQINGETEQILRQLEMNMNI